MMVDFIYTLGRPLSRDILFSFRNSIYQFGCSVAAVSAQRPVEQVKNVLQNITTERTPHSVETQNLPERSRVRRRATRKPFGRRRLR